MNKILGIGNLSIEEELQENIRWGRTVWFFALQGVFFYFTLKQEAIPALKNDLPSLII